MECRGLPSVIRHCIIAKNDKKVHFFVELQLFAAQDKFTGDSPVAGEKAVSASKQQGLRAHIHTQYRVGTGRFL